MSFIFYDTETTGTDKNFDQILQFAAIRTDADLNELERFEIRCRLHAHLAPSPGAMRVTRIGIDVLNDPDLPSHYEMVRAIRDKLQSWTPAIFAGYNSMAFDEPLLRQAFYQTLHPPYLTNTDGNCRADVMGLVQNVAFLHQEALKIPEENGKSIFKLDRIAPANGFDHAKAHDALGDVEATIHLCRLIRDKCPEAWSIFTRFSQTAAVLDYVSSERAFVLLAYYFRHCAYAVTIIGHDDHQPSVAFALDLACDFPTLAGLDDAKLASKLKRSPKPVRRLKANTAPFLLDLADITPSIQRQLPSAGIISQQLSWLDANPDFVSRLLQIYRGIQEEYEKGEHLEQRIHDEFLTKTDLMKLEEFHAAPWEQRLPIVEELADERYRLLGHRLIYRERPDVLPQAMRTSLEVERSNRLLGTKVGGEPWLTLPKALEQTNDLLVNAQGEEHLLLSELAAYLTERIHELANC